jgi:hypothetical protein
MNKMTIAALIRNYLKMHPEGALTQDVHKYCISEGAKFQVADYQLQLKSVSGQLSKMRKRGEVYYKKEGRVYRWFIA